MCACQVPREPNGASLCSRSSRGALRIILGHVLQVLVPEEDGLLHPQRVAVRIRAIEDAHEVLAPHPRVEHFIHAGPHPEGQMLLLAFVVAPVELNDHVILDLLEGLGQVLAPGHILLEVAHIVMDEGVHVRPFLSDKAASTTSVLPWQHSLTMLLGCQHSSGVWADDELPARGAVLAWHSLLGLVGARASPFAPSSTSTGAGPSLARPLLLIPHTVGGAVDVAEVSIKAEDLDRNRGREEERFLGQGKVLRGTI